MQLETYHQYDVDHVPGTIIGLHPIKKFDSLEAAQAVTKDWDDDGSWSIEPVTGASGDVLWHVIALKDPDVGDVIMLL